MSSIIILAASFITALIGIIRNNRAKPGQKSLFGLNLLGAILLGLSITGVAAALVQEIRSLRANVEDKRRINDLAQKLDQSVSIQDQAFSNQKEVAQKLDQLAGMVGDPKVKQALMEASSRLGHIVINKGEDAAIPQWVPIYPGAEPENAKERKDQNGLSGSFSFSPLPGSQIFAWYRDTLRKNEFTITSDDMNIFKKSGRIVAQDMSGRRRITIAQFLRRADVLWEERDK
jgi:hypothetical protein